MADWNPTIEGRDGPRYRVLAEALEEAIDTGGLEPGERLPTQRDLARRLGVTVGTVGRAYAEAERRKLISGEVGRGTFVRTQRRISKENHLRVRDDAPPGIIDLGTNHPPASHEEERFFASSLRELSERTDLAPLLAYQPARGLRRHREAGARWIGRVHPDVDPERVLVTAGAQHAMAMALSAVTQPGDVLLVEELTFPGILVLADRLGLRLEPVEVDSDGIVPGALEALCRTHSPRAVYTIPTVQNPTCSVMPLDRREAIAEIARRHDLSIIEDDVHGVLPESPTTPISALAPERSYYIANTSKTLCAGLRVGYLLAPMDSIDRLSLEIQADCWMVAPLMAELAAGWIDGDAAQRIVDERRAETHRRLELLGEYFPPTAYRSHPDAYHVWLELPAAWEPRTLVAAAARQGVRLTPTDAFEVAAGPPRRRLRLCLGAERELLRLRHGLMLVSRLFRREPQRRLSVL